MSKIVFQGRTYERLENVSVLDTLLDAGLEIPHGCKSGICQSCLMKASEGEVPQDAQKALKEIQQQKNFFLACSCFPEGDLTVTLPSDADILQYQVEVLDKSLLTHNVLRLRLSLPDDFHYKAGQFINVIKDKLTQRSYSLASLPGEDQYLELHIKILENGVVSRWLQNDMQTGDEVTISESHGDCYFTPGDTQQEILLIGTGTGLAPLYGVVRDALANGHEGNIYLYHGASQSEDLYLSEDLHALDKANANFHYIPCVSQGEVAGEQESGRANEIALQRHASLKNWKVYLCGNPNMVEATRKKAFLAGANFKEIFVDAFEFAAK